MKNVLLAIFSLAIVFSIKAQRGKDGDKVVTGVETVNDYTFLTADASIGDTSIQVNNSSLSTNFSGNLAPGDLIMIIQVQGVSIIDMAHPNQTPDWGRITNYNNCGNYEFVQVDGVPNSSTIEFDCGLVNDYTASGNVIIIRVPRYNTLTINSGGILTVSQWDGTSGGILAVEVLGVTNIQSGGKIDVSELGFRGGLAYNPPTAISGSDRYADQSRVEGAEKGEGIAGDQVDYANNFNGPFNRGAAANGGGGANAHNSGGGGGGNAGLLNWNNGVGNPDVSNANFITAWNLETSITGLTPTTVSSGGGRGGYSFFNQNKDPLTLPPGDTQWGPSKREAVGGLGGRPLDYSTGRIFMAGAGGAGEGNDNEAGDGGNAGGMIYLTTYDDITGAGDIISNGANGGDSFGNASIGQLAGKDGCGGGGAGGTIILKTTTTVSLSGQVAANGGKGGDQNLTAGLFATIDEGEGPGGGGGGGYIAISSGSPSTSVLGGINGITNCPIVSDFEANGATMGGNGLVETSTIDAFDITANDVSICPNTSTTLTATLSGTTPSGITIEWYDAEFNGNLLQTGANYTTPSLSSNTTYYVKTCPGTITIPVNVTINACGTPPVAGFESSDSTICVGDCISFNDLSTNTPSGWSWHFFGADSITSSLQNPTNICYNTAGSYAVALVASNPSGSDSIYIADFITVNALPTIVMTQDTAICIGDTLDLTASGGTSYLWDNGLGNGANHTVNPTVNTTYQVIVTNNNGCVDSSSVDVIINSLPNVVANANNTNLCTGDSLLLFGSGADSYIWDNSVIDSVKFVPSVSTTYNVTGTDTNGCKNTDQIIVTVGACGVPPIANFGTLDTNLCIGDCINFIDSSANFPANWTWYFPGSDSATSNMQNPSNICYNTLGSFDVKLVVSNANGSDSITFVNYITVNALPAIVASNDTSICIGDIANLSATGGLTYNWDNGLGAGQTQTPSPITNTTYTVTGTDVNGCVNTDVVNVNINQLPIVNTSPDTSVCLGTPVNLYATGGNSYNWDNGLGAGANQSPTPLVNTTYIVTVTDTNSCVNTGQVDVTVNPLPVLTTTPNDTSICNGNSLTLTASGAVFYNWDNGLGLGNVKNVTPTVTTTYSVIGVDGNTCTDTNYITVTVDPCLPSVASFSASDSSICVNDCIDFTDLSTNLPTNWTWYFFNASTTTAITQNPIGICYTNAGSYDVALVVSNGNGSPDSLFIPNFITVDSCNTPEPEAPVVVEVIVPNVFTPNVDGHNDMFNISGTGITELNLKIFNRWGELLFETNQLNEGWNGRTTSGAQVPEGTYFYIAKVTTLNGDEEHTGTVTLIR